MNLAALPHQLDRKKKTCRVVIETPKGRRNKFDYDPMIESFTLSGLLGEGLSFPFDFGFVPSTIASDGDPLDIIVLMDEPAHVGCVLDVRVIGIMEAEQTEKGKTTENDRLFGVAIHSYNHETVQSVKDMNKSVLAQIEEFFVSYNKSRGKKFKVSGIHGPVRAVERIDSAIKAHEKNQ